MGFDTKHIRPLAVAIIRQGNSVLAMQCFDKTKNKTFYRLLGGGIEYGEKAEEALCRELKEELGLEITILRKLGVEESLFTFEDNLGHEIVFFFEAEFVDKEAYTKDLFFIEDEKKNDKAIWVELDGHNLIYPAFQQFLME